MRPALILAFCATSVGAAVPAAADEDERRLSLGGQAAKVELDAFGTSDTTTAFGAALAVSWGIRNWLDLGLDASYLGRPNAVLADAVVAGNGGEGSTLYTNLHLVSAGGHVRVALDAASFHDIRPTATLRAGLAMRGLFSSDLFHGNGDYLVSADTDLSFEPFAGGGLGLSWRVTDRFAVALDTTYRVGTDHRVLGAQLQLSWFSYQLF